LGPSDRAPPDRWSRATTFHGGNQARLYRLVCPAGQGFLFARPMDAPGAEVSLRRLLRSA